MTIFMTQRGGELAESDWLAEVSQRTHERARGKRGGGGQGCMEDVGTIMGSRP